MSFKAFTRPSIWTSALKAPYFSVKSAPEIGSASALATTFCMVSHSDPKRMNRLAGVGVPLSGGGAIVLGTVSGLLGSSRGVGVATGSYLSF
jgi:hypothetical protein